MDPVAEVFPGKAKIDETRVLVSTFEHTAEILKRAWLKLQTGEPLTAYDEAVIEAAKKFEAAKRA